MYKPPVIDIPHGDEVSTEPQRQALEAMSQDLVAKLNAMVAEQERRAHEFARQQHSLSALPTQTLPELNAPILTALPQVQPQQQHTAGIKARMNQPAITNGPALPPTPQAPALPPTPAEPSRNHTSHDYQWDTGSSEPKRYKMPTIIREPEQDKKEGTIGAGTISIIIFIVLVLIMHGCE